MRKQAKRGAPTTFITLTVNPAWGDGPSDRAQRLVKAWRMLRQMLARKGIAEKIPFLCVFEKTKRGEPHLHILCRAPFIPQAVISAFMRRYMSAPIVDIRVVKNARHAAHYVTKYVAKAPHVWEGCKRYWRSQDWLDVAEEEPGPDSKLIAVIRRSYHEVMRDMAVHGETIADSLQGWPIKVQWWTGSWRRC